MDKLLVVCGPTAVGKTKLAVKLAQKFNGELISADSRQIYQGMDIGTGKDKPKGVKIHLLDIVAPSQPFAVAQYCRLAQKTIKSIWQRKKLPILVGGTGFYIKAVVDGIETLGIKPDWQLRKKLESLTVEQLASYLKKIAPEKWQKMNRSDRNNPRRLIRAIEIAKNQPEIWQQASSYQNSKSPPLRRVNLSVREQDSLFIGLKADNKTLYQRIDQRVEERIKKGMVKEIKELLSRGYSWQNSALGTTLGYRQFQPFFEKKKSLKEVIQKWKFAEHAYARRQMTWFRKDKRIFWFNINQPGFEKKVVNLVKRWYIKNDAQKN